MFLGHPETDNLCAFAVYLCRDQSRIVPQLTKAQREGYRYFIARSIYALAVHQNSMRDVGAPNFDAFCDHVASDPRDDAYLHIESVSIAENAIHVPNGSNEEVTIYVR